MVSQSRFAERRPTSFSFLLILLLFLAGAVSVVLSQLTELALTSLAAISQLLLAAALIGILSALGWRAEIGYRRGSRRALLIYAPALVLVVGNLVANIGIGVTVDSLPGLLTILLLGLLTGFTEETIFRGLILRAFRPRGVGKAVLFSTLFFGFAHLFNVLGGVSSPLYVAVQIAYALAIGFCFAAMAVKGGLLWPLALCHGLGNFAGLLSSGGPGGDEVSSVMWILSGFYILFFSAAGVLILRRR